MSVLDLGRPVGSEHPPFIIAALDCGELGTLDRALVAVDAAADGRCDAVKPARLPWQWTGPLLARAEARGLRMLPVALDEAMIERLDWVGASGFYLVYDWSDLDLVARAARTGKPIVLQVGTATDEELAELVGTARRNGDGGIALVRSVIDLELEGFDALGRHRAVTGIADRSRCSTIPRAAISRGASIVEKRLAHLSHAELSAIVRDCELAWAALDDARRWTVN
jgi:N-acetylneuraminate synthase